MPDDFFDDLLSESAPVEEGPPDIDSNTPIAYCEEGDHPFEWAGRGRKPKRCPEHRTRTQTMSTGGGKARGTKLEKRLERIQADFTSQGVKMGAIVGRYLPVTGLVLATRSDRFSAAICRLAMAHPEWVDALDRVAQTEPFFEIGECLAAVALSVGVDMGRINPESGPAQLLGITALWVELNRNEPTTPPMDYVNTGTHTPSGGPVWGPGPIPGFSPVGVG